MSFSQDIHAIDKAEMAKVIDASAAIQVCVDQKFGFIEGPVWFPDTSVKGGGYLLFSDLRANCMFKWSDGEPAAVVWREPSQGSNGNTKDSQGRLVTCEHTMRRVTVTETDGTIVPVVDSFAGKKFNSPNDVVVKSDGTVWFTDPPYGLPKGQARDILTQNVFRFDPRTGKTTAVITNMDMPNGLAFSVDEKTLYVAESLHNGPKDIKAFPVNDDGTLGPMRVLAALDRSRKDGVPDGIRVDRDGRVWSSAGDGVQIFTPDGRHIGTILTPMTVTNLTFGGPDGTTLYMTATTTLCRIQTKVTGATNR
jgi:gluconolactonase